MNVFCFSGNLGRDAETRYTQSGDAVAGFSVAVNSGYGDNKKTLWIDCSIWGKRAESRLIDYLKKGQQVAVSGELGTREWEGKTYLTCRVNEVTLIGRREESERTTEDDFNTMGQQKKQTYAEASGGSAAPDLDDDDIPF